MVKCGPVLRFIPLVVAADVDFDTASCCSVDELPPVWSPPSFTSSSFSSFSFDTSSFTPSPSATSPLTLTSSFIPFSSVSLSLYHKFIPLLSKSLTSLSGKLANRLLVARPHPPIGAPDKLYGSNFRRSYSSIWFWNIEL